eukprot:g33675.t1
MSALDDLEFWGCSQSLSEKKGSQREKVSKLREKVSRAYPSQRVAGQPKLCGDNILVKIMTEGDPKMARGDHVRPRWISTFLLLSVCCFNCYADRPLTTEKSNDCCHVYRTAQTNMSCWGTWTGRPAVQVAFPDRNEMLRSFDSLLT